MRIFRDKNGELRYSLEEDPREWQEYLRDLEKIRQEKEEEPREVKDAAAPLKIPEAQLNYTIIIVWTITKTKKKTEN